MRKNIFTRVFIIIIMLAFVLPTTMVSAASEPYSKNVGGSTVYMHDLADILTDTEELSLIEQMTKACTNIHCNILFLTTYDAENKSTMVYSDDYMDELFPTEENNIAFIIDMDNREIYVNTMGNAILCLTDQMIDNALDKGFDEVSDGNYAGCMEEMADYCIARLVDNPGTGAVGNKPVAGSSVGFFDEYPSAMVTAIVPSLIVAGMVVFGLILNHQKANQAQSASNYVARENYNIFDKDEIFVRRYETVQKDYYKPKSSSSGGGGSSHRSSSGRSHGGGGRKF